VCLYGQTSFERGEWESVIFFMYLKNGAGERITCGEYKKVLFAKNG